MVGQEAIKVTVVVVIRIINRPALLVEHQSTLFSHLGEGAVTVVQPDLIDATGVKRIVYELTALGDGQIHIAILVEITEDRSVVAAVVGVGVIGIIVIGQIDQRCINVQVASVALPHARQCVVVAPKRVELPVVVNVSEVARLHEHGAVFEVHIAPIADGINVLYMHAIVGTS